MSDEGRQMPQPTREHRQLRESAGVWDVDCTFYMDPSQPPMEIKAKETIDMLGEFWTVSLFEGNFFGMPFQGRCTLGYEPHQSRWVSTWIDVMSPHLHYFTGNFDADGKVLTMTGQGWSPATGDLTEMRTVEELIDPNTRKFEMFMKLPDGSDYKMFSYVYRRAG